MARITPLAIFAGVDDPPPRRRKARIAPVESRGSGFIGTDYTRELACEIAALNRENAALRADNEGKAARIQDLEARVVELMRRLYG